MVPFLSIFFILHCMGMRSMVSPFQKSIGCSIFHIYWQPQCLGGISAGLSLPARNLNCMTPAAMASLTLCNNSVMCCLCSLVWDIEALLTTDSLSPNMKHFSWREVHRYQRVLWISVICSVQVRADTNSDPQVAVSHVACFLEYQSKGVLFMRCNIPVADRPVIIS